MARTVAGVIAGFVSWMMLWFAGEALLSLIGPDWFGAPQRAFQAALENGAQFTADSTLLATHLPLGALVTLAAGYLAAFIARGNQRAPLVLACLLLAMGLAKAAMSWQMVPLWYHVAFTALLPALAIVGGKLAARATP